jgi:hypothetical protein
MPSASAPRPSRKTWRAGKLGEGVAKVVHEGGMLKG